MRARDIMTRNPECCRRDDTAREAARVMRDHDCGVVPIVDDGGRVVGIVTDRDLAIRGIAAGKDVNTRLNDLMTPVAVTCGQDDDLRDVDDRRCWWTLPRNHFAGRHRPGRGHRQDGHRRGSGARTRANLAAVEPVTSA